MFGIKTKIFLPLVVVMFIIIAYFYAIWVPRSIAFSVDQSLDLLHHTLEIVEDQITQDMVEGNITSVRQKLDLMLLKNPSWRQLILKDQAGNVLYPVDEPVHLHEFSGIRDIFLDIKVYGKVIGSLALEYDFSEMEKTIRKNSYALLFLLTGFLAVFAAAATGIIQHFVVTPAIGLTRAAQDFINSNSQSEFKLPPIRQDQIGDLISSFSAMKTAILEQQISLKKQNHELILSKEKAEQLNRKMQVYTARLEEARSDALQAQQKAEKANHAKSEFLANMSHELRTPLNSIMGLARMLVEDKTVPDDNRHMAETVHKSAVNLLEIVNDILDISKIEAGSMVLENIGFDLKMIVSNILESLAPIASTKGVSLNCSYLSDNMPYIVGDPLRLGRIITNLASNAIKYTHSGSVNVVVGSRYLDLTHTEIICRVQDTGIGIPQNKLDIIFDKFTQADESTTRQFGGTGLGLSITRDLVHLMGGEIGVESEVGKGSTFWFRIPFVVTKELQYASVVRHKRHVDRQTYLPQDRRLAAKQAHLLVAEDHLLNQDFIKRLLRRLGVGSFDVVENGALALEACSQVSYDLILMDCHMPEMNGYDATRKLRERETGTGRHIPVVALTADAMKGTQEKCNASGMDEYVTKPIDAEELKEVLSYWLEFPEIVMNDYDHYNIVAPAVVNLSLLEEYADTPEEMHNFIEVFLSQSRESLLDLKAHCVSGSSPAWVEAAHKLKGGAGMIGAQYLSTLCEAAQNMPDCDALRRSDMYQKIRGAFHDVESFLKKKNAL